jgi:phospholipase/carboxylesterase
LPLDGGFEWYRLRAVGVPDDASFATALSALDRFIGEAASAYPLDPRRLFLLGFSQGGMMAFAFALTQPARVAGVLAHSSYLPRPALEAAAAIDPAGMRGKPVIITHGTHDPMIPAAWARAARDELAQMGAAVAYHEFPMGHHVSDRSIAALDFWLHKQLEKVNQE